MGHPLRDLQALGQSPWHDNIHRGLLTSGALRKMVRDGDITGLTSNPTIFEQAIARSTDYDDALDALVRRGRNPEEIVDTLAIEDIAAAADLFQPVYHRTKGDDGYVSIEVSPALANDTDATIREAHRLWRAVRRPNLMVKIPATRAGIGAIERCIADGLNINVTLIFSLDRYQEVMNAYLRGLSQRLEAGKLISRIASVASFFVSRVDTKVDKQLEARIAGAADDGTRHRLRELQGKAAIANAKLAYALFHKTFAGEPYTSLARAGARRQRPLWASTSTKNPAYPDVYYVEALVGPDTVDTMPPATLVAYKDHGQPARRLDERLDDARAQLDELERVGIHMANVTQELEDEGVEAFAASYRSLVDVVGARREAALVGARTTAALGASSRAVTRAMQALDEARVAERLWKKDTTLWKGDDAAHQAEIAVRLGWLDVVGTMQERVPDLTAFVGELRDARFTHAVLCGMGGSSLAPDLFRRTFGVARGHLDLAVLDSTDPQAVLSTAERSAPASTLYVVSSKSGGTVEVTSFFRYFWDQARAALGDDAGAHFVAITDPGTSLETLAQEHGFRRVFLNPPEIGGRYSALSYFGLVPAALVGVDLNRLLERAARMLRACSPPVRAALNPGLALGATLGTLAQGRRDKVTFLSTDKLSSFGLWAEQLLAESTGKEGRGIVPVAAEPIGKPSVYGPDRVFVHQRTTPSLDRATAAVGRAGHPLLAYRLNDAYDLGAEFIRWEIATAVAGHLMQIDPFDQPNVQEAKDHTKRLLAEHAERGSLPVGDAVEVTTDDLADRLAAHLRAAKPRSYVAINAYVAPNTRRDRLLTELRTVLRDRLHVATTVGYGPRFLHSTGQLHKGGPASGVFLELICTDPLDVPVPGASYSFGILKAAQALGDHAALTGRGRRALRVALGATVEQGLAALIAAARKRPTTRARKPAGRRTTRRRAARRPVRRQAST